MCVERVESVENVENVEKVERVCIIGGRESGECRECVQRG